jgi:hypothetical protein
MHKPMELISVVLPILMDDPTAFKDSLGELVVAIYDDFDFEKAGKKA